MAVKNPKAIGKKSFILYTDSRELWESLPNEQAGKLIKHIVKYMDGEECDPPDELTKYLFIQIKSTLDRDQVKWEATKAVKSENGKKGGRPPKSKKPDDLEEKQNETNKANGLEENLTKAKKAKGFDDNLTKANKAVSVNANATVNENAIVEEEFYDIDILYQKYLTNNTLIQAAKQKMEFIGELTLEKRLLDFNLYLKAIGQNKKTWKDYLSHFMNWHEKTRKPCKLSAVPTFQNPVI